MKSIDTYLCKEKKEVYKVSITPALGFGAISQDAVEAANRQQDAINEYRRKCENMNRASLFGSLFVLLGLGRS